MLTNTNFYDGFKVLAIATPREKFTTALMHEKLSDVAARNSEKFDFMPVLDRNDALMGIVELARYFDTPAPMGQVADHFVRLGEHHLIGADAGILEFILDADRRRFRFVVSQNGVVGLVSLSDLQELSVRTTLFSLVTNLELTMRRVILNEFPNSEAWLRLLRPIRRANVSKHLEEARKGDGAVEALLYTQFCDKRDILLDSLLRHHTARDNASAVLRSVEKLRNALAHANEYAETSEKAAGVCQTVRDLLNIKDLIERLPSA